MNVPASIGFWRTVAQASQTMAAELSTAALPALAAELLRVTSGARTVFVYVQDEEGELVLRAQTGPGEAPLDLARTVTAMPTMLAVDDDVVLPLLFRDACIGVVGLRGGSSDEMRLAGAEALAGQLAVGLGQAAVYEELEALVEREMTTAVEREQAMQLVLDSMGDGLLVCELTGRITAIRSKAALDWFGEPGEDAMVWSYLGPHDPKFATELELAFLEIAEDFLPFESNAALIPRLLRRDDRAYAFDCRQVFRDGAFTQIALTVRDVTDALEQEQAARAARELPDVVGNLLRDREGFREMLRHNQQLLDDLACIADAVARARIIHTLKGNSAIWGFASFSAACHALEDVLDGDASMLAEAQVTALARAWRDSLTGVRVFLDEDGEHDATKKLHVTPADQREVLDLLARRADPSLIAATVASWERPHLAASFRTLARQAERLGESLGKRVRVIVDAPGRAPALALAPLVAELVHAVRNALDHGIETPAERLAQGKPETATLRLEAKTTPALLEIVVEDDGRGIDWSTLALRASELGLGALTPEEVLFAAGVSTKEEASAMSGRGVGMAAVRASFRQLGGEVSITSAPGKGTRITCQVPLGQLAAAA